MRYGKTAVAGFLVLCALAAASVLGSENAAARKTSSFTFGLIHRFRIEAWDNAVTLDSAKNGDTSYSRHRTSFLAKWAAAPGLEFNLKLTNEFRLYNEPKNKTFTWHEIFVDSLYVKWRKPADLPLTLTLGRQDIQLGEGFVIMDGGPLDGSRSAYFNAGRADFNLAEKQTLTAFYLYQPETDTILPVIHDQHQPLIEQPEEGFGVYYTGAFKPLTVESYLIQKNIRKTDLRPVESGITTLGLRFTAPLVKELSLTAEGAVQGGHCGDADRSAFGGHVHLDYQIKNVPAGPLILTVGGIALSGDDPNTSKNEGWDPLFSRWPKWSEALIYTLAPETGRPAYWTNLTSLNGSMKYTLAKPVDAVLIYHHLSAFHAAGAGKPFPGGEGTTRGDLVIAKLIFRFNKMLTGHLWYEHFTPGDYYRPGADSFNWFRFELLFRI